MALQTSGAISLADIQSQFGGSNPIGLNEYYRGGAYVPSGTAAGTGSRTTAPLPVASPAQISQASTIQLSMFYGTTNVTYTYPANGQSISATDYGTGGAVSSGGYIGVSFNSNGSISHSSPWQESGGPYNPEDYGGRNSSYSGPATWVTGNPSFAAGNFELMWQYTGGNNQAISATSNQNVWTNMGNGFSWTQQAIDESSPTASYISMNIFIRPVGGSTQSTTSMTLSATYPHEGT